MSAKFICEDKNLARTERFELSPSVWKTETLPLRHVRMKLVPGLRIERKLSALQADVQANYTNRALVAGDRIERSNLRV